MKLNVGGTEFSLAEGVNSNDWFDVGEISGPLPRFASLNFYGKYTCSGSSSTRTYTVNFPVANSNGCGGNYDYSSGVNSGHGVTFNVRFIPLEIEPLNLVEAPSCLEDDLTVNIGPLSAPNVWYYVEAGIFNSSTGTVSNIKDVHWVNGDGTTSWPGGVSSKNIKTALGATYSTYVNRYIVYRGRLDRNGVACGQGSDLRTGWSAPHFLYPESPVINGNITSTPPYCAQQPSTATLTIPPMAGTAAYTYTVTKLIQKNVAGGITCAGQEIEYNSITYCPGTSSPNQNANGSAAVIFAGLTAGLYQITVEYQGSANPCTKSSFHEISEPAPYTATASANALNANGYHIPCYGGSTGSISLSVTNGQAPFTYKLNGTARTPDISSPPTFQNLTANGYTVVVTDNNGCITDAVVNTVTLTQIPQAQAFDVSFVNGEKPKCYNGSDGYASLQVDNGAGPFNYFVNTNAVTPTGGGQRTPVIGSLSAGIAYTIKVVDNNSCSKELSAFTFPQPDQIIYSGFDKTNLKCYGQPTGSLKVLNPSGGTNAFQFAIIDSLNNQSAFQSDPEFINLPAHKYRIKIRDSNLCPLETSIEKITQPNAIAFSVITHTPQSCTEKADGKLLVSPASGGTGARKYSLDDIDYTDEGAPTIFSLLPSGNHTVYAKDANECVVTTSHFIPILQPITGPITINKPISCYGDNDGELNLTPGGGSESYTFEWTTASWSVERTTEDITGLDSASYSVKITDSNGCNKTFDYILKHPQKLKLQSAILEYKGKGVSCYGTSDGAIDLTVTGGTSPYSFDWSHNSTSEDVSGLAAGKYDVDVVDSHSCPISLTDLEISAPDPVGLFVKSTRNISCYDGDDGQIKLYAVGGVSDYEFSLDGTVWQNDSIFNKLKAVEHIVYFRDGNDCHAQLNRTLTQPSLLEINVEEQLETSCGESNGSAMISLAGGAPSYRYAWYDENKVLISSGTEAIQLRSGDYEVFGYDSHNCADSVTVIINDSNGPRVAELENVDLTCHDSDDGKIKIDITHGLLPYKITWDTQATDVTEVNSLDAGEHWVEVLDANACRVKKLFDVKSPAALGLSVLIVDPSCKGSSDGKIDLTVTGGNPGGYIYQWTTGQAEASLSGLPAALYHVTIKDSRMCSLEKDVTLVDPPLLVIDAGGNRTICVGQILKVNAPEDNATYEWTSDAGFNSTSREVSLTIPAKYTLKVITQAGCVAEDSFMLQTSTDLLQADFLLAHEAHAGDTIVLIDISWPVPERISWTFPEEVTVITQEDAYAEVVFEDSGVYSVVLNTFLGECIDEYGKSITILGERPDTGGRKGDKDIGSFEVHPNPSDGKFTVSIELNEIVSGRLIMVSTSGNSTPFAVSFDEKREITYDVVLDDVPAGLYFLILEAGHEKQIKRLIIR
jgi:hypothetical protein